MFSADDYTDCRWHQRLAPIAHDLFTNLLTENFLSNRGLDTLHNLNSVALSVFKWYIGWPFLLGGITV